MKDACRRFKAGIVACLDICGDALGYIVIGLLAFLLGVCVTILCFRLRQMSREDGQNEESEDTHGAD